MKQTRLISIMTALIIAFTLALTPGARPAAQDFRIKHLSTADAERGANLYKQMQDAEKAWADFRGEVELKYVLVAPKNKDCQTLTGTLTSDSAASRTKAPRHCYPSGWSGGIQFSDDFTVIVPALSSISTWRLAGSPSCTWTNGGTLTTSGITDTTTLTPSTPLVVSGTGTIIRQ